MCITTSLHPSNISFSQVASDFCCALGFVISDVKLSPLVSIRLNRVKLLSYPSEIYWLSYQGFFTIIHTSNSRTDINNAGITWVLNQPQLLYNLSPLSQPSSYNPALTVFYSVSFNAALTNELTKPMCCQTLRCRVFDGILFSVGMAH